MGISRQPWSWGQDTTGPDGRARSVHLEQRRATRAGVVCDATLACPACDAPIAVGPDGLSLTAPLTCPFCATRSLARDCLSLSAPTRPAHVVVRVSLPAGPSGSVRAGVRPPVQ